MSRMARQYQGLRSRRMLAEVGVEIDPPDPPNRQTAPAEVTQIKRAKAIKDSNYNFPKRTTRRNTSEASFDESPEKILKIDGQHKLPLPKLYKTKSKPSISTETKENHNIENDSDTTIRSETEVGNLEMVKSTQFNNQERLLFDNMLSCSKNHNVKIKSLSLTDLTTDTLKLTLKKRSKSLSSLSQNDRDNDVGSFYFYKIAHNDLDTQVGLENRYKDDYDQILTPEKQKLIKVNKYMSLSTSNLTEDQCCAISNHKRSRSAPPSTHYFYSLAFCNENIGLDLTQNKTPSHDESQLRQDDDLIVKCNTNDGDSSMSPSLLIASHDFDEESGLLNDETDCDDVDNDEDYDPCQETDNDAVNEEYGDVSQGRKRRHVARVDEWKKNKAKRQRMLGEKYLGYSRDQGHKYIQNQERPEKQLGEACTSEFCRRSKFRGCASIDQETRREIHTYFWKRLDWKQRKVYVKGLAVREKTHTKRTSREISRRQETLKYFLPQKNNAGNIQVCQLMFLNTLSLKSTTVKEWTKQTDEFNPPSSQSATAATETNPLKRKKLILRSFLNSLPKMPSHYARKDTRKLYLEPGFRNTSDVYKLYKEHCKDLQEAALSRYTFDSVFKSLNLSTFTLKKDMCDICISYKEGNYDEHEYQLHNIRKNRAREEKEKDKKDAESGEFIVLTMDLEAVKLCPHLNASALYFKTKLTCHNFTVFDLTTRHCTCYWFTETAADLTASTFASFVIDYLERHCLPKQKPIIIYSDGCTYQNRNAIMANALLNFSLKHKVTVTQKFLEPGHTQMECDSVHSVIERKLANREIHLPSDYVSITKEARSAGQPYEVIEIDHSFVKNYADSNNWLYKSIRPGRRAGDPTVTDIRAILYNQEETLKVKLNFDEDWATLPLRPKRVDSDIVYSSIRDAMIPITASKFKHLQELKQVLPRDCHYFYDSLPHQSSS